MVVARNAQAGAVVTGYPLEVDIDIFRQLFSSMYSAASLSEVSTPRPAWCAA